MDRVEASGKTVEDALNRALAELGASRDEVEFVVLDEGKRGGLFGRGGRDAHVRVERLSGPRPDSGPGPLPDTRIPRGQQQGQRRTGTPGPQGGQGRRGAGPARGGPRGSRADLEPAAPVLTEADFRRGAAGAGGAAAGAGGAAAGEPPAVPVRGPARGARPARGGEPGRPSRPRRSAEPEGPLVDPDINAEEVDFAAQVIDDILQILGIEADITIREPITPGDGRGSALAVIDLAGEDLGLLIGRRGDTLAALQYFVNLVLGRRFPERGTVTIDIEHYRHRREDQLVALARRMSDRVRETGSSITLEPMPPAERRLIHLALADDPDVETNSFGDGDNRKVVISPRE